MKKQQRLLVVLAVLVVAMVVLWALYLRPEVVPDVPARTAAELAATPDDQLEGACARDLSRQVYAPIYRRKAGWRQLAAPSRAVWVLLDCESRLRTPGTDLASVQAGIAAGAEIPDFNEVKDACAELGLDAAAAGMGDIVGRLEAKADSATLARLQGAWLGLVGSPAARRTRLAYIRKHLPEMVTP